MKHKKLIPITSHALLRYLQRVKGVDMIGLCEEIVPPDTQKLIHAMGDGIYPVGSHRVVVKNKTVITIYL